MLPAGVARCTRGHVARVRPGDFRVGAQRHAQSSLRAPPKYTAATVARAPSAQRHLPWPSMHCVDALVSVPRACNACAAAEGALRAGGLLRRVLMPAARGMGGSGCRNGFGRCARARRAGQRCMHYTHLNSLPRHAVHPPAQAYPRLPGPSQHSASSMLHLRLRALTLRRRPRPL